MCINSFEITSIEPNDILGWISINSNITTQLIWILCIIIKKISKNLINKFLILNIRQVLDLSELDEDAKAALNESVRYIESMIKFIQSTIIYSNKFIFYKSYLLIYYMGIS